MMIRSNAPKCSDRNEPLNGRDRENEQDIQDIDEIETKFKFNGISPDNNDVFVK